MGPEPPPHTLALASPPAAPSCEHSKAGADALMPSHLLSTGGGGQGAPTDVGVAGGGAQGHRETPETTRPEKSRDFFLKHERQQTQKTKCIRIPGGGSPLPTLGAAASDREQAHSSCCTHCSRTLPGQHHHRPRFVFIHDSCYGSNQISLGLAQSHQREGDRRAYPAC